MYATSGYFYGSGSIRLGDMWGGAGLYRPSGSMVFGIEDSDWIFSKGAVTQAYFSGGDGNLWMRWAGDWLSNLLGAKQNASTAINTSNISSQSVNYAASAGSASNLQGYSAYDLVTESRGMHSGSDFPNGTLVRTDIDANGWAGNSFVMEVSGKSYGSGTPFKLVMEGYLYADTIINVSAMSYGSYFPGGLMVFRLDGKLCFWWARGSYWNSFEVHVRSADGESWNRVTSIGDSPDPGGDKRVGCTPTQVVHSGNIGSQSVNYASSAGGVAWTNVSGRPTALSQFSNDLGNYGGFLTSYTETDTLASVTGRGASTNTAITINNLLTITGGRVLAQTGGENTYGIFSGYNNNNHLMTMRASISGSTASPTLTPVHQMTFVEYAQADDTTGWFFKSSSTGTYEEIARVTRTGIYWSGNTVLHSANYNSYAPTLTGGGASGTWGISITGSAGSVAWGNVTGRPDWMTSASLIASHSNANSQVNSGFYENGGGGTNWPSQTWYNSINVRHSNQGNYHGFQVAMSYYDNLLWFRSYQGSGTFQPWVHAISSGNIGSQSVNYANTAGSASSASSATNATQLTPNYAGDVYRNPQVYFNNGIGVKVAMTGAWSVWSDTLWINGYSGGDVPWMCALHFLRNSEPRFAISAQTHGASDYGTYYEVITSYNVASQSVAFASNAGNANSISNAVGGQYTWTGINYFRTNQGGYCGSLDSGRMQAYSDSNNSAFFSWHKGGHYATNMGLDADNVIRIGGWSAAANRWQLDMSGNMTVAGDVTAYSDARVKTDVKTIENALLKVLNLRGVSYVRTDSEDKNTKIGVIAQETLQVVPEVVNQDAAGMYNVSYGNMVGLLIEAIKEQQKEIDELKAKLN
jgi:hypothetical protein